MSYPYEKIPAMDEDENSARLRGLLAVCALPMVRCDDGRERRRLIEVEVSPGKWVEIHGVTIEAHRLIVWSGGNGTRQQFEFRSSEGCPAWRIDKTAQRYFAHDKQQPRTR